VLTDGFVKLMQQFPSIVSELRERIGTWALVQCSDILFGDAG
jgi:hypothetical protein